ncbi:MAG: GNAT family N-acetyltransferase [Actinomycetota bacterium]
MNRRRYRGEADVDLLQEFNANAIRETDGCGFVHPGDIAHRLFNGNKLLDPADVLTIWEDGRGVAAWVLVSPRHAGFDAQVRPDLRSMEFETEVLTFAEIETMNLMRSHGVEKRVLDGEAYRCDEFRSARLVELGWTPTGEEPWVLNRIRLGRTPEPQIPDGYSIRAVLGVEEAGPVSEVHAASFGSTWTAEMYRKVMESPGYPPDREFVVEAPNGTLAAFTVTWHDTVTRTGLFEPVGTHEACRRLGLGKALLLHAMSEMARAGMEYATVVNEGTNEASRDLYRSVGFEPWHLLDGYAKPIID